MKILSSNLKNGEMKLQVTNKDDLWYLSHLIEVNDKVKGKTFRKIKTGGTERSGADERKSVFLEIRVESVEFSKTSDVLRVLGVITQAPEDVPLGLHHTFGLEENTTFTLWKPMWLKYQLNKIKEASEEKPSRILICVHDREDAYFGLLKKYGFDLLTELRGNVEKKADTSKVKNSFYDEMIAKLKEYDLRHELNVIILASPAFFKEDVFKLITDKSLKSKIILATCNHVGRNGITEVLKRPEVNEALRKDVMAKEHIIVEQAFSEIAKNGLGAYGFGQVKKAAEGGAVEVLLVTDGLIKKMRSENKFYELDDVMKMVDKAKGDVHLISTEHEAGKKLDGLGGLAAILRYKLEY